MAKELKYAFRILHIDNIPNVEKVGLVRSDSPFRNPDFVSIGDKKVIRTRFQRQIQGYNLSDYIPFYLGPRSPMLYVIQHGYNGVQRVKPGDIVYCIVRLDDIKRIDIDCIFTDGHALSACTKFYTKHDLDRINFIVKYADVYASRWDSELDLDLKRRKEAEILLKEDLKSQYIRGYVVYDEEAKDRLKSFGVEENRIVVNSGYYF